MNAMTLLVYDLRVDEVKNSSSVHFEPRRHIVFKPDDVENHDYFLHFLRFLICNL